MNSTVGLWMAFSAGLFSFLSPCVLPLLPSYLGTITGLSLDEMMDKADAARVRKLTLLHSLSFILGFSVVFVALGATATIFGKALYQHQKILRMIGGAIVILLGIHFTGLFNFAFLQKEKRFHIQNKPLGYLGSFAIGLTFAFGWTPCIGPILGSILMLAATEQSLLKGIILLSVFSFGFGAPFILVSLGFNQFMTRYQKFRHHIPKIIAACGVFLIVMGILIMTNNFNAIAMWLNSIFSR